MFTRTIKLNLLSNNYAITYTNNIGLNILNRQDILHLRALLILSQKAINI